MSDIVERLHELDGMRKPGRSGVHGQQCGMETYTILATGNAFAVLLEVADELERLTAELAALRADYAKLYESTERRERDELRARLEDSDAQAASVGLYLDELRADLARKQACIDELCACKDAAGPNESDKPRYRWHDAWTAARAERTK